MKHLSKCLALVLAAALVLGLARGDLDWRCIVNPSNRPIA